MNKQKGVLTIRREARTANRGFAKAGLQCKIEHLEF